MIWRLMQNWKSLLEGSCISEQKYRKVYYLDKYLYEPISDEEKNDWIEVEEKNYCEANGLECLLFYTEGEVKKFLKELNNVTYLN